MQSLEVLSLSVNHIASLKDVQNSYNLRELYLRKNLISSFHEVRYLTNLKKLRILWLGENPIADHPKYRYFVISLLPQIERLDNDMISAAERDKAEQLDFSDMENFSQPNKGGSPPKYEQQHNSAQPT